MTQTVSAAWTLATKDLRSFVRDRTALLLTILVPIALVTVFGWIMAYAFGGSGAMPKIPLHVADLSQSAASEEFVGKLKSSDMLRVRLVETAGEGDISEEGSTNKFEQLVRDGDATHVLVIPATFSEELDSGTTPSFQMFRDPGREMEDRIVQIGVMQAAITSLGPNVMTDAMDRILSRQGMDTETLGSIRGWMTDIGDTIGGFYEESGEGDTEAEESVSAGAEGLEVANSDAPISGAKSDPSSEATPAEADSGIDMNGIFELMSDAVPMETKDIKPPQRPQRVTYQQAQSVAGMSVMMLLFALTSCGSVLLTEREDGTLRRLFAQPISRNAVLLGKFFFVMCIGIAQMAILFTYGEWMFGVGLFQDPVTLVVLSLVWVATGGAFGMFLASVSRSTKQAESLASLLILMMAALGGCWFPLQLMSLPTVLDTICKSTMTFWAMTGFQSMLWNQLPWYSSKVLTAISFQLGWATVLTGLAIFFYRRNFCRG
ncbi:MAG: ABC transporter permease [Planctomycetota bacterium]